MDLHHLLRKAGKLVLDAAQAFLLFPVVRAFLRKNVHNWIPRTAL